MIYVGIDTGVNTGFAVWDSKQRSLLQVCSLPIHKAMERVRSLYDGAELEESGIWKSAQGFRLKRR